MVECLPPGNEKKIMVMVDIIYPKLLIDMDKKKIFNLMTLDALYANL